MRAMKRVIRARFPSVQQIACSQLAALLNNAASPLLLDVRQVVEYNVSHIAGARHVLPNSDPRAVLRLIHRCLPAVVSADIVAPAVVLYCSAGYRSSALADALIQAGFPRNRLANLEGSLFEWANEQRPMQCVNGLPTTLVHPYNSVFGRMLAPNCRAAVPLTQEHH